MSVHELLYHKIKVWHNSMVWYVVFAPHIYTHSMQTTVL